MNALTNTLKKVRQREILLSLSLSKVFSLALLFLIIKNYPPPNAGIINWTKIGGLLHPGLKLVEYSHASINGVTQTVIKMFPLGKPERRAHCDIKGLQVFLHNVLHCPINPITTVPGRSFFLTSLTS